MMISRQPEAARVPRFAPPDRKMQGLSNDTSSSLNGCGMPAPQDFLCDKQKVVEFIVLLPSTTDPGGSDAEPMPSSSRAAMMSFAGVSSVSADNDGPARAGGDPQCHTTICMSAYSGGLLPAASHPLSSASLFRD